jgi:hypothetical protein
MQSKNTPNGQEKEYRMEQYHSETRLRYGHMVGIEKLKALPYRVPLRYWKTHSRQVFFVYFLAG